MRIWRQARDRAGTGMLQIANAVWTIERLEALACQSRVQALQSTGALSVFIDRILPIHEELDNARHRWWWRHRINMWLSQHFFEYVRHPPDPRLVSVNEACLRILEKPRQLT